MDALNKLKAICEAATPGPWRASRAYENHESGAVFDDDCGLLAGNLFFEDAAFISTARSAMPALIELVEAMEWERECSQAVSACAKEAILRPSEENKEAHKVAYCIYKDATVAVEAARAKLEAVCPK